MFHVKPIYIQCEKSAPRDRTHISIWTYSTYTPIRYKQYIKSASEERTPYFTSIPFSQIPHISPLQGHRADKQPYLVPKATMGFKRAGDKNLDLSYLFSNTSHMCTYSMTIRTYQFTFSYFFIDLLLGQGWNKLHHIGMLFATNVVKVHDVVWEIFLTV